MLPACEHPACTIKGQWRLCCGSREPPPPLLSARLCTLQPAHPLCHRRPLASAYVSSTLHIGASRPSRRDPRPALSTQRVCLCVCVLAAVPASSSVVTPRLATSENEANG